MAKESDTTAATPPASTETDPGPNTPAGRVWEMDPDLPVDPAADLLREMTDQEYERLKADVQENGQQEPAVVRRNPDRTGWILLDGRHRQRACRDLARKLLVREWDGREDVAEYV